MLRGIRLWVAALTVVGFTGCIHHHHPAPTPVVVQKAGPPPHAPAHGYRRHHHRDGVDLVFDSHAGVYVVVGWDHHFYSGESYFRFAHGVWETSADLRSGWRAVEVRRVPVGLRGRYVTKRQRKHKHSYPANHDD